MCYSNTKGIPEVEPYALFRLTHGTDSEALDRVVIMNTAVTHYTYYTLFWLTVLSPIGIHCEDMCHLLTRVLCQITGIILDQARLKGPMACYFMDALI